MTPEAAGHLDKAGDYLTKARGLPNVLHYTDEAGRAAYFAGYHAAQALIFERTGREAKTHKRRAHPVQQNGRGDPRFDTEREPLDGNTKPRDAEIAIVDGAKIQMFYDDHTPPHFHVTM